MVTIVAAWLLAGLGQSVTAGEVAAPDSAATAAKALAEGSYPWYDAKNDAIAPVQPPWAPSWWERPRRQPTVESASGKPISMPSLGLSNLVVFLVLALALSALIAGLIWAYRYYMPENEDSRPKGRSIGASAAIGGLPPGLPANLADPLGLARELRARGDLAGAIVALFVHQVMTLDRLRLARLAPGRTARQLVRSVSDAWVRAHVEPTLRVFEASFYGHRVPAAEVFDQAWSLALELEARIAQGAYVS